MVRKIIWVICNLIAMFLSAIYNNSYVNLLPLLSIFSIAFLYDNFVVSIKDFKNKKITKKMLYKEFCKFETLTPTTLKIFFEIFIGTRFLVNSLIEYNFISLYQNVGCFLMLIAGIAMLISFFKDIIKFK